MKNMVRIYSSTDNLIIDTNDFGKTSEKKLDVKFFKDWLNQRFYYILFIVTLLLHCLLLFLKKYW